MYGTKKTQKFQGCTSISEATFITDTIVTGGKWPKIFGRNWPKETAKVGKCPKFCVRKWPKKNDMLENIRNLTGQPIGRLVWHFYCSGSRHMGLSPTPAHTHRGPPIIPPPPCRCTKCTDIHNSDIFLLFNFFGKNSILAFSLGHFPCKNFGHFPSYQYSYVKF